MKFLHYLDAARGQALPATLSARGRLSDFDLSHDATILAAQPDLFRTFLPRGVRSYPTSWLRVKAWPTT